MLGDREEVEGRFGERGRELAHEAAIEGKSVWNGWDSLQLE